jgi:hypothetical protein
MKQEKSAVPLVAHETYPEPREVEVSNSNECHWFVVYFVTDSLLLVFLCRN